MIWSPTSNLDFFAEILPMTLAVVFHLTALLYLGVFWSFVERSSGSHVGFDSDSGSDSELGSAPFRGSSSFILWAKFGMFNCLKSAQGEF